MPDPVHFELDWLSDVMTDQLKAWIPNPMRNVLLSACEVIVQADHLFSCFHQTVAEMGSQETSTSCDQIASERCWHLGRQDSIKDGMRLNLLGLFNLLSKKHHKPLTRFIPSK